MKLGFCMWLLSGVSMPEKIEFLSSEGFSSCALLQGVVGLDEHEFADTTALIREKNFSATYHGNLHANLTPDGRVDDSYAQKIFEDVIKWHENTNGVVSCCSDAITNTVDSKRTYLRDETLRLFQMEADFFENKNIGYGIENGFFMPSGDGYCAIEEMKYMQSKLKNASNAGMIFDVGHANVYLNSNINNAMTLDEYIEKIPFKIYELHITDNRGKLDEHLLPGEGTINYGLLRKGLEKRSFDGIISLEICPDIINGKYTWDISREENKDVIRRARDHFIEAYRKDASLA